MAFVCHIHGEAGLAHLCEHIHGAIEAKAPVPSWLSYPLATPLDEYIVLRVCVACATAAGLPVPARMLRDDEAALEQLDTEPSCEACFVANASSP